MWHFILIRARFLCRITFRCACPHKEDQNPYWEYQSLSGIPISNGNTNLFICKMGRLHFTFTRTWFLCRITFRGACPYKENQKSYREYQSLSGIPILIGNTNSYREDQSLMGIPICSYANWQERALDPTTFSSKSPWSRLFDEKAVALSSFLAEKLMPHPFFGK